MLDPPRAEALIGAVADYLGRPRDPNAPGTRFEDKVAVNALQVALREIEARDTVHAAEEQRLRALTGSDGDLLSLNAELARRLLDGTLSADDPAVRDHLWATTMAKVAVDQPVYASYRAELAGGQERA